MKYAKISLCCLTLVWSGALGCEATDDGTEGLHTGTETNWLKSCDADVECGELSCLCGVCTQTCSDNADCSFSDSECRAPEDADTDVACSSAAAEPLLCLTESRTPSGPPDDEEPEPGVNDSGTSPQMPGEPDVTPGEPDVMPGEPDVPAPTPDSGTEVEPSPPTDCDSGSCVSEDGGSPWACDPGEVPPELDQNCETNADCTLTAFAGFCGCTATALGYNLADSDSLEAHLASCENPMDCDCAVPMLQAENGDAVGALDHAVVECVAGQCVTQREPTYCAGSDECLLLDGECAEAEARNACRGPSGECQTVCATDDGGVSSGYLLWQLQGGAAGVGPTLELEEDGTLRLWERSTGFEPHQTSSPDLELTLTAEENEEIMQLLLAVDTTALPHEGTAFECYPTFYFEPSAGAPIELRNYPSATTLRPEFDEVYGWFDAYLADRAPEQQVPSSYCVLE